MILVLQIGQVLVCTRVGCVVVGGGVCSAWSMSDLCGRCWHMLSRVSLVCDVALAVVWLICDGVVIVVGRVWLDVVNGSLELDEVVCTSVV